jgi:hypothetical protein
MAFESDLTQAATPSRTRNCLIARSVAEIEAVEPGWASGIVDKDGTRHPGFWEVFNTRPDVASAELARAINLAAARLGLTINISAGLMRRCRRGECSTDHTVQP